MGSLKILKDGIRVVGRSEFEKPISFNKMQAGNDVPFVVESSRGVALTSRNVKNNVTSRLIMGKQY